MTKIQKKDIETIAKANRYLASLSVFCIFAYVAMLGMTAVNVVTLRAATKTVEDKKTELSMLELSYMNESNALAVESAAEFSPAKNISYATGQGAVNSVAVANTGTDRQ